ncbi:3'(2'),5'-bisphosphate nucleotidase CysQ [Adhaeribacter pallidiroseus]|uniref:3'(2'),5'-bisphosphate nucleotidase CysQ n=1 Tax=Adhaeribacter pallidiroseus TaxID=2072847 RepID=A0A369QPD7_9BACT|nr:3'(2'),5'-bisphosphate nucleotidase CysQ [Adhaeribacter pallidiroseus]RDC64078.1 3'(2'),5'-bisphosphate nucleotidase [Adhaeribacter pallidiroseus]
MAAIDVSALMPELLLIAKKAGEAIMQIYNQPASFTLITLKSDQSPLTQADQAANDLISVRLAVLTPNVPVLSEEGKMVPYEERQAWPLYWCVDPLDGTKEFISRNGEFTVNIALIVGTTPVAGVIYAPVTDELYFTDGQNGAYKVKGNQESVKLAVIGKTDTLIAVKSRSHGAPEEIAFLNQFSVADEIRVGSSLKFCLIAEGKAQLYFRHGPTMEWDTAAGHAILAQAGGKVTGPDGEPFTYNKPSLLNGSFLCTAWQ